MSIYLDNASITRPKKEVIEVVNNILTNQWYNPSSVNYEEGLASFRIVEQTRSAIANEINCNPEEIVFCGSGSEANCLATDGWLNVNGEDWFYTSTIEHSSILNNKRAKKIIKCDADGFFIEECFNKIPNGSLVSLQYASNEIGVIQKLKRIVDVLHKKNCIVHSDCVQAFGHIKIDVKDLGIDMISATSQKLGGICGSAFLYVKNCVKIESIIHGAQNNGLRGSTYNLPAIAAFGKAIELIDYDVQKEVNNKRNYLIDKLLTIDNVSLNGVKDAKYRLPNNINIRIDNVLLGAQELVALFGLYGYCLSSGSACHQSEKVPSHVLLAIGLTEEQANHSIRITIGEETSYEELDKFFNDFKLIVEQYKE